jgi:hypothetical protein
LRSEVDDGIGHDKIENQQTKKKSTLMYLTLCGAKKLEGTPIHFHSVRCMPHPKVRANVLDVSGFYVFIFKNGLMSPESDAPDHDRE